MREAALRGQDGALARELLLQQLPLAGGALLLGYVAAHLQHGFVPGGDAAWPLAGVHTPVWQVVWMGMWTGYLMALVGQAAGVLALPYTASVLQFSNSHVSPSTLLLTLLNPLGALLGWRHAWNPRLAGWLCAGGAAGALAGPFLRSSLLADAVTFRFVLGLCLVVVAAQLLHKAFKSDGAQPSSKSINPTVLFVAGAAVGTLSAALGLGGAFLMVPFLVLVYRMPMHAVPALTLPYAVALSAAGLFSYCVLLPLAGRPSIAPEWAWGFFAAAGGMLGAWAASKTQRYLPESLLNAALAAVTGWAGALYVVEFFS